MTTNPWKEFDALAPFFRIVEEGLRGIVAPGHFFDLLADDVVTEFVITVPGYPKRVEGRDALIALYRPYRTFMTLERAGELAVHHDREKGVVVLEYAVEGRAVGSRKHYRNHFVSVVTVKRGKVTHWRDYLDPIAVFDALGWPNR